MGGLAWFAIPWLCATTMGLAAIALESNPVFPTYPNRLPAAQVSAGLVLPNAAVAMLGKGGAGASLLMIFMAVTSAMSAELIAVSSIFTYDIYQGYINTTVCTNVRPVTKLTCYRLMVSSSFECPTPPALSTPSLWLHFPLVYSTLVSAWATSIS